MPYGFGVDAKLTTAMYKRKTRKNGFTLVELLVVIAIIAILASIILSSLGSARVKSRDARRMSDLRQIRNAMELYYAYNGSYPNCPWVWSPINTSTDSDWNTTGCVITALRPYIARLPVDPRNNATNPWETGNYSYRYGATANLQEYDLIGQLEDINNVNRCAVKQWPARAAGGGTSWCYIYGINGSPYVYADH